MKAKALGNSCPAGKILVEGDKKNICIDSRRLFIAITLPEAIRMQFFESINCQAGKNPLIKPVSQENIHLTLKFLGPTKTLLLPEIVETMRETAESFKSFSLVFDSTIGAFPDISAARILFVKLKDTAGHIKELFTNLEYNLEKLKVKKEERKFIPHITIARIRDSFNAEELVKKIYFNFKESINCSKINLFESRLMPSGPKYIILREFELK